MLLETFLTSGHVLDNEVVSSNKFLLLPFDLSSGRGPLLHLLVGKPNSIVVVGTFRLLNLRQ